MTEIPIVTKSCPYYEFIKEEEEGELDMEHCNYPTEYNDGDCVGLSDKDCPLRKYKKNQIIRKWKKQYKIQNKPIWRDNHD